MPETKYTEAEVRLVDRSAAQAAVELALPLIQRAMTLPQVGESGVLYIVVMDPARGPRDCAFEEAILYERAVGRDRSQWDVDYSAFARAKAKVAWRTGRDSHLVQELSPHLLAAGDTLLWGTAVLDGIVVAASGAHPWYDEAFAGSVAMCLRAIAQERSRAARKLGLFLPA